MAKTKQKRESPIPYMTVRCNRETDLILIFVSNNGIKSACDCNSLIVNCGTEVDYKIYFQDNCLPSVNVLLGRVNKNNINLFKKAKNKYIKYKSGM